MHVRVNILTEENSGSVFAKTELLNTSDMVANAVRSLAQRSVDAEQETAQRIQGALLKREQSVNLAGKVSAGIQANCGCR